MIIAIDCDDVLIDATTYIVKTYNESYGTNVQIVNAHNSKNSEWNAEREIVFQRLHDIQDTDAYATIRPHQETIDVVKHLAQDHELHIITARPAKTFPVTQLMVDTYFPDCFKSIEHVGPDASKGEMCENLVADVMIDDNVRHLADAHEHGVGRLIWFGDYPWQANQDASKFDVTRCYNWTQVEHEIERMTYV